MALNRGRHDSTISADHTTPPGKNFDGARHCRARRIIGAVGNRSRQNERGAHLDTGQTGE